LGLHILEFGGKFLALFLGDVESVVSVLNAVSLEPVLYETGSAGEGE